MTTLPEVQQQLPGPQDPGGISTTMLTIPKTTTREVQIHKDLFPSS